MEKTARPLWRTFLTPALAVTVILLGLLSMSSVFTRSQQRLVGVEDGQLMKTAQSVDNNILGHFAWYCSDLTYVTTRKGMEGAEAAYLTGGDGGELLCQLRESPLPNSDMVDAMLVLRDGVVELSTDGKTDYIPLASIGRLGTVDIALWLDGADRPYVALLQSKPNITYAALIDGENFFDIAERQTAAEERDRILVLDAQRQYFFHRTAQGIRVDPVDHLDPAEQSDLQIMLTAHQSGQPLIGFFRGGLDQEYTARLAVLPALSNENGCFTVGVARNYDEAVRPFQTAAAQMVLCSAVVMAGAAMLVLFLMRSRQGHQRAQKELALLRAKTEAMEKLNAQTQALAHRQRLETIGTLTSGIAHEFNNLLTPIMGYSILILEKLPPEDTESYDNALEIYNASQKAKNIIARLSRLSRKGAAEDLHPVRLDPLAEQVLEVAAPARPKAVQVESGLDDRGGLLLGDETQLFQLMLNLVLNAFEALGPGGGTVRITTCNRGKHISLRVADNGPGIPKERKDKIFDPFFTTKGSGKGIGLGLAIVQQIVDAHGGTITVESAQGQGTAFTVLFPAAPPQAGPSPET